MEKTNIFKWKPPEVHFTIRDRVPFIKLITNLACSSRTVEYWPSVVFVRTSLRSVRTATTSGQYSPVRPSRLVSKRLLVYLCLCSCCLGPSLNIVWVKFVASQLSYVRYLSGYTGFPLPSQTKIKYDFVLL